MYRSSEIYDNMAILAINVYLDYNIHSFPVDVISLCRKMQVRLVPYSAYFNNHLDLLLKKSKSGFFISQTNETSPMIFYNDDITKYRPLGIIRRNIMHEVKHYICEDKDETPEDDDVADYFAKYFLAPIPVLIYKHIENINEIISIFEVDQSIAESTLTNVKNRKAKYGNKIFEYEKPLIEHLFGEESHNQLL